MDEAIPENASGRTNNSSPDIEMIQEIRHTDKKIETHNIDDSGDDDSVVMEDSDIPVAVISLLDFLNLKFNFFFRRTSDRHCSPCQNPQLLIIMLGQCV